MKYIVYQTLNKVNNKIYVGVHKCKDPDVFDGYIGCGVVITSPSSYMNPYTPFQYAVKKYGTSKFVRTTLKVYDNEEDAYNLEKEIVTKEFIDRDDTYNIKVGGFGGSSYYSRIYQFDLNCNLIKKWTAIIDAADFYNVSDTAIANAIKFKRACRDFYWSRNDSINKEEYVPYRGSEKIVCYQYNLKGKVINIYNSIVEAANDNNTTVAQIRRAVQAGYRVNDYYYSNKLYESYTGYNKLSIRKRSIYIYSLEGDYITELKNSKEIYDFFGIKTTHVITVAIRANKPYKEYQISLDRVDKMDKAVSRLNLPKKVGRYSNTGDLLEEFNSATEAVEKYGFGAQRCLKGIQKQCKGFIFKYI